MKRICSGVLAGIAALGFFPSVGATHSRVTSLFSFGGREGAYPLAALIEDRDGYLYGTTFNGGGQGGGTVFRLAPDGTETVLHAFTGKMGDGINPYAGLVEDQAGNLYGTTSGGGNRCYSNGCGTVFRLARDGTETVLHSFDGTDGAGPYAAPIEDKAGNLYGTTAQGGGGRCEDPAGCGTVFKLTPFGAETVLHAFRGGSYDGDYPIGGLIEDKSGNLYGTTFGGGGTGCNNAGGCGTVFKVAPDGTETILYSFAGESSGDGSAPYAGLMKGESGNLYGTTEFGGGTGCSYPLGCGTVFKIAPDGTEAVLHAFLGGRDGAYPMGDLIRDRAGNFYGTTQAGGVGSRHAGCGAGCGTVFKLTPDGAETVLYAFKKNPHNGIEPYAGLINGGDGQLYGTTSEGGHRCGGFGCGTIFRLDE